MSLFDRITARGNTKIPVHQFGAILAEYARGLSTRGNIIAEFGIAVEDEADLDVMLATLDNTSVERRSEAAQMMHDVCMLAEQGRGFTDSATLMARMAVRSPRSDGETVQRVVIRADANNNATSLIDVPGLSFAVEAGKSYAFEFNIIFQTPITTTGIALSLAGPALPAAIAYQKIIPTSLTAAVVQSSRAYNIVQASAGVDAANSNLLATIRGTLVNGPNAGALVVRFATEIAGSAVLVKAGSNGVLHAL